MTATHVENRHMQPHLRLRNRRAEMVTDSQRRFLHRNTQGLIEGDKSMAINGDLIFENVEGPWQGNDFPKVSVVSVTFNGVLHAFVFLTHMNIDFDGAGNAYGPPDKNPLDTLDHAGQKSRYYGLVSIKPDESRDVFVPGKGEAKENIGRTLQLEAGSIAARFQGVCPRSATGRRTRWVLHLNYLEGDPIARRRQPVSAIVLHQLGQGNPRRSLGTAAEQGRDVRKLRDGDTARQRQTLRICDDRRRAHFRERHRRRR
jgi:hypothetical protein